MGQRSSVQGLRHKCLVENRLPQLKHPRTYDRGAKPLPPTNFDRDIERKLAPGISYTPHTYDSGAKGLPPTSSDGDIERKLASGVQGCAIDMEFLRADLIGLGGVLPPRMRNSLYLLDI